MSRRNVAYCIVSGMTGELGPSGVGRGRPRDQAKRQAILSAAIQLLDQYGYHGLTVEGVAARAQVGKSTIYRWWPGKQQLVVDALSQEIEISPYPDAGTTEADLRQLIEQAIVRTMETPAGQVVPVLGAEGVIDSETSDAMRDRYLSPRRQAALEVIERCRARGDLVPEVEPNLILDVLFGATFYRALVSDSPLDDRFVSHLVGLFMTET